MFVVFEGIDGSGKTTLAGRVAAELDRTGISVHQARPKGELKSRLASKIRTLARDPRNLTMSPITELFLYVARDTQTIDTVIRPSLDRAEVVIADRYLFSAQVLCRARGEVDPKQIEEAIGLAAGGLWPDLVVYCDVDIDTSYTRKRIDKILNPRAPDDFGRKGLRGLGLREAMRREYLAMASADPDRWLIVDNANRTVDENAAMIADRILSMAGKPPIERDRSGFGPPIEMSPGPWSRDRGRQVCEAFYEHMKRLAEGGRKPEAAYHLRSIESDRAWEMREMLVSDVPELVVFGLGPLSSPRAIEMRWRLVEAVPGRVARSLSSWWADDHEEAWRMRHALAEKAPFEVAGTLGTLDSQPAWEMRDRLKRDAPGMVLSSLKNLDSQRAWETRRELSKKKTVWGLLEGLAHLDNERAWELRRKHEKDSLPWVILSTLGCDSESAWAIRRKHLDRATKLVLRSMAGSTAPQAWAVRNQVGKWAREALTTIKNIDTKEAWELRRALRDTWPVFATKSVGMTLAGEPHGYDFLWEMVERHPADPGVVHFLVKVLETREDRGQ